MPINMNPKKPKRLKSRPAGISLEPAITDAARAIAVREGFASLSAYVRHVLVQALNEAADVAEQSGKRHKAAAKGKLPTSKNKR